MREALLPIAALMFGAAFLLSGNGLLGLLIPVRAGIEGFPTFGIGALQSAYHGGFVAGCLLTPYIVRRVGHIRAFAVFAALAACTALGQGLLVVLPAWILLRAVTGWCFAGLVMVIESWLNERATNQSRGQVFATYMMLNFAAIMAGQLLLSRADPTTHVPFVLVGVAICISLIPVSLTTSPAPAPLRVVRLRLGRLYGNSPVGTIGCLCLGLANGAFWGLAPVYAHAKGLPSAGIALFMASVVLGGALIQWPLGRLSDRFDRRFVILGTLCAAIAAGFSFLMAGSLPQSMLLAQAALLGACVLPLYGLCVAHTNDFTPADEFVEASGGLLLLYGLGSVVGPIAAAQVMGLVGDKGVFLWMASIHVLLAGFTLWRMRARAALPPDQRPDFVAVEQTTPEALALDPRAEVDLDSAAAGSAVDPARAATDREREGSGRD
jgi:MFS family permease